MTLLVAPLGVMDYPEALALQFQLLNWRQRDLITDTLLLLEHPPVITIGKSGNADNILLSQPMLAAQGIGLHRIQRGGDVTYHGPGQLVGYPIMDLTLCQKSVKTYIHRLEQVFINLLAEGYGIEADRDADYIGVWTGNEKIVAVGVAVKKWVTMHGFAFNINPNLSHFGLINPCGITDKGVTSLAKLGWQDTSMEQVSGQVVTHFCDVFDKEPQFITQAYFAELAGREENAAKKA